jgi:hypothetical protein
MLRTLSLALALAGAAAAVQAADPVFHRKPGLWEMQMTNQGGGAAMPDMHDAMSKMSPEQRAMVEKMMKDRGVGTGGKPNSMQFCLTKEQADKAFEPHTEPGTDCKHDVSQTSSSEAKFSFSCTRKDGTRVEGNGRAYDLTPESYKVDVHTKTVHDGKPIEMDMKQQGHWLGADCKGLKPIGG